MPTKKQVNLTKQLDLITAKQKRLKWKQAQILGQLCETLGVPFVPGKGPVGDGQVKMLQLLRDCRDQQSSSKSDMKTSDAFREPAR